MALVVLAVFAELDRSASLFWVFAGAGFFWLAILFCQTAADYLNRYSFAPAQAQEIGGPPTAASGSGAPPPLQSADASRRKPVDRRLTRLLRDRQPHIAADSSVNQFRRRAGRPQKMGNAAF